MLLPPKPGTCPACASEHGPEEPHDAQSMYYLYRFYGLRGRWPTWEDAAAHCTAAERDIWRRMLENHGEIWTTPPLGVEPIADPPGETVCQTVEIDWVDPWTCTIGVYPNNSSEEV